VWLLQLSPQKASARIIDIENTSNEVVTDTNMISDSSFQVSYTSSLTLSSNLKALGLEEY
jgi:hypothetical protein